MGLLHIDGRSLTKEEKNAERALAQNATVGEVHQIATYHLQQYHERVIQTLWKMVGDMAGRLDQITAAMTAAGLEVAPLVAMTQADADVAGIRDRVEHPERYHASDPEQIPIPTLVEESPS